LTCAPDVRVVGLHRVDLLLGHRAIADRDRVLRGPDENGQVLDLGRQGADHLLAGGTGANDADAEGRESLALGPGGGVYGLALERLQTGQVREVDGRQQSDRVDDIGGPIHGAVVGGDFPLTFVVEVDG